MISSLPSPIRREGCTIRQNPSIEKIGYSQGFTKFWIISMLDTKTRTEYNRLLGAWWYSPLLDRQSGCRIHGDPNPLNYLFNHHRVYMLDFESSMEHANFVHDLGIVAAELKNHFAIQRGDARRAEPYIGHFLWQYSRNEPEFHAITRALPFFISLGLLRMARMKLGPDHRSFVFRESKACLESLGEIAPKSYSHLSHTHSSSVLSILFSILYSSSPQPYMQPVRVVDAQAESQIPGFPGTLHILIGAICHYPDSFLIQIGNQLLQLFGSPAPCSRSQYKFQVNVQFIGPVVEMEIRSSFRAHHCIVNLFQDCRVNGIGAVGLDVNLHTHAHATQRSAPRARPSAA